MVKEVGAGGGRELKRPSPSWFVLFLYQLRFVLFCLLFFFSRAGNLMSSSDQQINLLAARRAWEREVTPYLVLSNLLKEKARTLPLLANPKVFHHQQRLSYPCSVIPTVARVLDPS